MSPKEDTLLRKFYIAVINLNILFFLYLISFTSTLYIYLNLSLALLFFVPICAFYAYRYFIWLKRSPSAFKVYALLIIYVCLIVIATSLYGLFVYLSDGLLLVPYVYVVVCFWIGYFMWPYFKTYCTLPIISVYIK